MSKEPVPVTPRRRKSLRILSLGNPLVRLVLRSPVHWALSGRLMLLTYTGTKTGNTYTLPIAYFHWGDGRVLAFSRGTAWSRRIAGREIGLRIRGRTTRATARLYDDRDSIVSVLGEFVHRKGSKAASRLLLGLPSDVPPTPEDLEAAAMRTRIVEFKLL